MPVSIQEVLSRLSGVKRGGEGYVALCPAHEDGHHSLSIGEGKRGVLLNCHAGCKTEDVAAALDMRMRDLFFEEQQPSNTEYEYRDADGVLRYVVERRYPKDFRQRRPDGAGGWIWNLKGVSPLPYRLPELLAADLLEPVYIVEGEKDVDALRERGMVATCNSGGAGKWKPELSPYLVDRNVVILPDNDDPGRDHAARVEAALAGIAASVRIIALDVPKKGDVSDWFAAGHTVEELQSILRAPIVLAPDNAFIHVHDYEEPPPQRFVVDQWIPEGFITTLFAMGGSSKSFLSQHIGMSITLGQSILGREVIRGPVLFLDGELDLASWLRRGYMLARGMNLDRLPRGLVYRRVSRPLTDAMVRKEVVAYIKAERPVLTIIDSFTACLPGSDTNSIDDVSVRMKGLEEFGTILLIDHTKKTSDIDDATPIGSVAKMNFARSAIQIASSPAGASVLKQTKSTFGPISDAVAYALNFGGGRVYVDQIHDLTDERLEGVQQALPIQGRILAAFHSGEFSGGATPADISDSIGASVKVTHNKLMLLQRKGEVIKNGKLWHVRPGATWGSQEGSIS